MDLFLSDGVALSAVNIVLTAGDGAANHLTLTDSVSGDLYTQWLQNTSANPYVVAVRTF